MNPGCIYDEDGLYYEDNEGNDYPINPFINPFGDVQGSTGEDENE